MNILCYIYKYIYIYTDLYYIYIYIRCVYVNLEAKLCTVMEPERGFCEPDMLLGTEVGPISAGGSSSDVAATSLVASDGGKTVPGEWPSEGDVAPTTLTATTFPATPEWARHVI